MGSRRVASATRHGLARPCVRQQLAELLALEGVTRFCDAAESVPMDGVVRKDWREAVVDDKGKIERMLALLKRDPGAVGLD
ncbi:hypothetical protein ACWFR5_15695 [Streptomyces sp. NPDC055092]